MSVVTVLPDCKHGLKTNATSTPTSMNRSRNSLKSLESSLYTTTKFSALSRRKGSQRNRNPSLVPAVSEIKQRVISARLLRMKQLQNQIGEAHHRVAELTAENRLLKSLHKRQDSALSKYESTSAELPQLLHSHAEEVRVWQTRCRNLQRQNKDLMGKIKQKDTIILTTTDQNKHLLQLNKDKNLEEREKLADRVRDLEQRLLDKDHDMKLLARRLQLESKAFKSNLHMEQQKYRDLVSKIELSDFMMQRTEIGDKKTNKPLRQNLRGKSPPRAYVTKSATNHTNGIDKDLVTLVLPPCEGQEPKPEETLKTNSPRVNVNSNVKLMPHSKHDDEDDEENELTKNYFETSEKIHKNGCNNNHDDDEIAVTIRNGMNRAKQQQKSTKIPPLHQKHDTKKSSDDSEFSDGDFHLFSEHNGTKMAHNARDLLDHKLHLSQLESKMKQNSLDVNKHAASSSSSSLSEPQHPVAAFDDIAVHSFKQHDEFAYIQREIRDNTLRRESLLDEYCNTFVDEPSAFSGNRTSTLNKVKKLELASAATNHLETPSTNHTYNNGKSSHRKPVIDSKKKNTLLAALKHIDDDSFEN